jgi:phosphotransferase system  glucose/maltose/N-acetylglucosamine-specific IIC component
MSSIANTPSPVPMLIGSVLATSLTLPTLFLILPVLVLPLSGLLLGFRAFLRSPKPSQVGSVFWRVLSAMAMLYAVSVFIYCFNIINTGYRP